MSCFGFPKLERGRLIMRILTGILLASAFLLVFAAPGTGDFYVAMLGTENEVPDSWPTEVALYIGAATLVLAAAAFTWVRDRTLALRQEQTFFPESWLLL